VRKRQRVLSAAFVLVLSGVAIAANQTIECEDFKTVQKGEDPTDAKFGKYPVMGDTNREGVSGGKTVSFAMVKKSARKMPFIETPVTVEKPGEWVAWVRGMGLKPMKPGTMVLLGREEGRRPGLPASGRRAGPRRQSGVGRRDDAEAAPPLDSGG
jgi:hypothetical protein